MLVKLGVDISKLNREIRRALKYVTQTYNEQSIEPVITSTYEGHHMDSSLHYANDAFDVRSDVSMFFETVHTRLKERLGPDYDIIREKDHIHIEYDPK